QAVRIDGGPHYWARRYLLQGCEPMALRKVVTVILATFVVAGFGVRAGAQSTGAKKTAAKSSKAGGATTGSKARKTSSKKGNKKQRGQQAPTTDRSSEIQRAVSTDRQYSG